MLRKDFRMLKLEYLFENYELAREALSLWEHDEDNLEEMLGYFRISSNAVYPFTREGRVCFLRLAPVGEKAETDVRGELEFIRYLLKEGYPALRPVRSLSGEDMVVADTGGGRYFVCVFEKVDGVEISETGYGREVMYAYGRALGRLHALSSGYVPAVRKRDHKKILEGIRRTLEEYGGCRQAFTELAAVERELGRLPVTTENYGLVHYDFEPDNVFWDEGKKKCSVIDFDDGIYCWYGLDLEQVRDSLAEELEGEQLEKAWRDFQEGYACEYAYPEETRELLPLMRRFVDLRSYAGLIRCIRPVAEEEPQWLKELRGKLNGKIERLEEGFSETCPAAE